LPSNDTFEEIPYMEICISEKSKKTIVEFFLDSILFFNAAEELVKFWIHYWIKDGK